MWWQWLIFGLIILAVPYGLYEIKKFATKRVKPTEKQNKIANQRFAILCLFYWLCDCFYMTFIINNLVWKFILGGLIMVIIFYNLSKAFINGNRVFNFGLIQDFIVGIALTVYLIYIIPNQDLQNIIIPIVSAVYGGLLTLVGVAWTIKKSDRDRKEEEIKKAKPLFTYDIYMNEPLIKTGTKSCFVEYMDKQYRCHTAFGIDNSNHSAFELKRIYNDGEWFDLVNHTVVLPDKNIIVFFDFNDPHNIFLEISDSLSQLYYYEVKVLSLGEEMKLGQYYHTIRSLQQVKKEYVDNIIASNTKNEGVNKNE